MNNKLLRTFLILAFSLTLCNFAIAQTVTIDQNTADACSKAFDEVTALRKVVSEFLVERTKSQSERVKAEILVTALDDLIKIKSQQIEAHKQLNEILQGIIVTQQKFIEFLQQQLLKPKKSTIQQIINGFKKAVEIIGFIGLGKLLSEKKDERFFDSNINYVSRRGPADSVSGSQSGARRFRFQMLADI